MSILLKIAVLNTITNISFFYKFSIVRFIQQCVQIVERLRLGLSITARSMSPSPAVSVPNGRLVLRTTGPTTAAIQTRPSTLEAFGVTRPTRWYGGSTVMFQSAVSFDQCEFYPATVSF